VLLVLLLEDRLLVVKVDQAGQMQRLHQILREEYMAVGAALSKTIPLPLVLMAVKAL
jgi:hypothetical protein